MSYRDDHEAAIARVVALEADVRKLEAENAKLRSTQTRLTAKNMATIILSVTVGLSTIAFVWWGLTKVISDRVPASSGTGTLRSTGPTFGGPWTFEVGRCVSGQHVQFYGVDIVAKDDPSKVMRVLEDPIRGAIVRLNVVGQSAARFIDRNECTKFDVDLRATGPTVDGIRAIDGHVELQCKFSDGGTLDGRLEFTSCN